MPLPVRLEKREPVDREDLGEPVGSRLEDALRVVLSLQRARGLDEKAREAAFVEDANLAALKPCDRHDIVAGIGARRVDDERSRKVRTHPVLDANLGDL